MRQRRGPKRPGLRVGGWQLAFLSAVALCLASLVVQIAFSELSSGNVWGIAYGIACTVVLVAVALFGLRRRMPALASRLRIGNARGWLRFHLYGGVLFLLLMTMRSSFRLPSGALTWWLWGLSVWTVVSGMLGLALQRWLPRVLASGLSTEVLYERIPMLIDDLRQRSETLSATCGDAIRALYAREVAPALVGPRRRFIYFVDVTGGIRSRLRAFDYLRGFLPEDECDRLDQLETLYRAKLELDAHYTLQWPLRWWLMLHVPLSLVLLVLVGVHVFTVLYY
jgi:hypothetical protein